MAMVFSHLHPLYNSLHLSPNSHASDKCKATVVRMYGKSLQWKVRRLWPMHVHGIYLITWMSTTLWYYYEIYLLELTLYDIKTFLHQKSNHCCAYWLYLFIFSQVTSEPYIPEPTSFMQGEFSNVNRILIILILPNLWKKMSPTYGLKKTHLSDISYKVFHRGISITFDVDTSYLAPIDESTKWNKIVQS